MGAKSSLVAMVALAALAGALVPSAAQAACKKANAAITKGNARAAEKALLCLVNKHRARSGIDALRRVSALDSAARRHSRHMASTGRFDHEGIGNGTPSSRAAAAGYDHPVGENIASGSTGLTARDVFRMWKASAGHNRLMLGPFVVAGVGLAKGGGKAYATLVLGMRPARARGSSGGRLDGAKPVRRPAYGG